MRKTVLLSTGVVVLMVALAVAVVGCGGTSNASSTTSAVSSSSTSASETSTTIAETPTSDGEQTTTSVSQGGETTSSSEPETTSTSLEETTTTEVPQTTDTSDHAAEYRALHPSSESFDNSNWATLASDPNSHLGAAVDVKGVPSNVTVDPDSRYLTWQLAVSETGGQQVTALCRTNIPVDRSLLSAGSPVEVKGVVVGAEAADAGGGPIIYVESVQKAS